MLHTIHSLCWRYQSDPPATVMSCAEMPNASSRQRNAAKAAISSGVTSRFWG